MAAAAVSTKVSVCAECHSIKHVTRCGRCLDIFYCSVPCQKNHWPSHKHNCKEAPLAKRLSKVAQFQGKDDYNYPLFLCTNEVGEGLLDDTYRQVNLLKTKYTTVVAVSGFFGLNLLAQRSMVTGSKMELVMFDISEKVGAFWNFVEETVRKTESVEKARAEILAHVEANQKFYIPNTEIYEMTIAGFQSELARGLSWLSSDKTYAVAREVFIENRFAFLRLDLREPIPFQTLAQALGKRKVILYLANTYEVMRTKADQKAFVEGVGSLIVREETCVVDTEPCDPANKDLLIQRVRCVREGEEFISFFEKKPLSVPNVQRVVNRATADARAMIANIAGQVNASVLPEEHKDILSLLDLLSSMPKEAALQRLKALQQQMGK